MQLAAATPSGGCTQLGEVRTVEHLLAALVGLGITDADVLVDGPELPILDGSSQPWCEALHAAGWEDGPPVEPLAVGHPVRVEAAGGRASYEPDATTTISVEVDFDDGPRGSATLQLGGDAFCAEVAWARTFVLARDVARLRSEGRGRGATPANTVVVDRRGAVAPAVLRAGDEPVRHKLLDATGDLALLGQPFTGRFHFERGSHHLHHALVRALLQS